MPQLQLKAKWKSLSSVHTLHLGHSSSPPMEAGHTITTQEGKNQYGLLSTRLAGEHTIVISKHTMSLKRVSQTTDTMVPALIPQEKWPHRRQYVGGDKQGILLHFYKRRAQHWCEEPEGGIREGVQLPTLSGVLCRGIPSLSALKSEVCGLNPMF